MRELVVVIALGMGLALAACAHESPSTTTTAPTSAASTPAAPVASSRPPPAIAKDLPLVAIVRADWCPACRATEPKLAVIEHDYAGKVSFLKLDVTDDDTTAGARLDADSAGVGTFFDRAKGRTATIGVFSPDRKELFVTWGLKSDTELRAALDDAIKASTR